MGNAITLPSRGDFRWKALSKEFPIKCRFRASSCLSHSNRMCSTLRSSQHRHIGSSSTTRRWLWVRLLRPILSLLRTTFSFFVTLSSYFQGWTSPLTDRSLDPHLCHSLVHLSGSRSDFNPLNPGIEKNGPGLQSRVLHVVGPSTLLPESLLSKIPVYPSAVWHDKLIT